MLILASKSPRRQELLRMAEVDFTCIPSQVEEVMPEGVPISQIPVALSLQKAEDVYSHHPEDIVIGADTVVEIDGQTLGKPGDAEAAHRMLRLLSGKVNTVHTGVTIRHRGGTESFVQSTKVRFYELSDEDIEAYIATGEPFDKAGAYGIQGRGSVLIESIEGDYFNVMGFPLAEAVRRLVRIMEQADGIHRNVLVPCGGGTE